MPDPINLPWGRIEFGLNEMSIVSTVNDPAKLRIGATECNVFGAISGDYVRPSGVQEQKILIKMAEDDNHPGQRGGMMEVFLQRPGTSDDENMIRVLTLTTEYAQFHVPVRGLEPQTPGVPPNELRAPNGIYWQAIQDDGNSVLYKNSVPFDYSTGVAYWASGTV